MFSHLWISKSLTQSQVEVSSVYLYELNQNLYQYILVTIQYIQLRLSGLFQIILYLFLKSWATIGLYCVELCNVDKFINPGTDWFLGPGGSVIRMGVGRTSVRFSYMLHYERRSNFHGGGYLVYTTNKEFVKMEQKWYLIKSINQNFELVDLY